MHAGDKPGDLARWRERPTGRGQRAQVKRPDPEGLHPPEEKVESRRSTSSDRHAGHCKSRSASCMRRNISKVLSHFRQRYS